MLGADMEAKEWMWARNLSKELWLLQEQGCHCDIDIMDDSGTLLAVHSCVMAATSSFFKVAMAALKRTPSSSKSESKAIVRTRIPHSLLPSIVRYLYTGHVEVERNKLCELHMALAELGVKDYAGNGVADRLSGGEHPSLTGNDESGSNECLVKVDVELGKSELEAHSASRKPGFEAGTEKVVNQESRDQTDCKVSCDASESSKRLSCSSCGKAFLTRWRLKKHMELHETGQQPFQCKTCGKRYSQHGSLWKHEQTHKAGRPFRCSWCGSDFKARHVLVGHVRSVHNISVVQLQKLVNHGRPQEERTVKADRFKEAIGPSANVTQPDFMMFEANEPSVAEQALEDSESDSGQEKEGSEDSQRMVKKVDNLDLEDRRYSKLTDCSLVARRSVSFSVDLCEAEVASGRKCIPAVTESQTSKPFSSDEKKWFSTCGKAFRSRCYLKKHKQLHDRRESFKCQKCGRTYGSLSSLWAHQQSHRHNRFFQCPSGSGAFKVKWSLRGHSRSVPKSDIHNLHIEADDVKVKELVSVNLLKCPDRPEDLQCPVCGKFFKSKYYVRAHMKVHSDTRPFSCDVCGKAFKAKTTFLDHVKRVHEGVNRMKKRSSNAERYWCSFCFKGFKMKQHLLIHEMRHRGERPFPCRHCADAFVTSTERKTHETKHMRTLPYQCAVCGKRYPSAGNLTWHMISHSDERPFPCAACGKRFKTNAHRKRHEARHGNGMASAVSKPTQAGRGTRSVMATE